MGRVCYSTLPEMEMGADRFDLLAKNALRVIVSSTSSGSSAFVWMSEAAMLEASISISQPVSIAVSGPSGGLRTLCNASCSLQDWPGGMFAIGIAWPSKALIKNNIRLSTQLAQTLGYPAIGSVIFVSSLKVKCCPDIRKLLRLPRFNGDGYAGIVQECKTLSLHICQGSFCLELERSSDLDGESISPLKASPFKGSPLKSFTRAKSTVRTREISSDVAKSYLKGGSSKMKEVVEKLVGRWIAGRLLLVGNMVTIPVCGSECIFHVKSAEGVTSHEEELSEKLKGLAIQGSRSPQVLYFANHKTSVNINLEEESNAEEPEKLKANAPPLTETASCSYSSLGGLSEEIITLKEIVEWSLLRPETFARFGLKRSKGVLLYGPPGTGKTSLAQAVANEANVKLFVINGPEIVTEFYGESEAAMKAVFDSASRSAPSMVFIDEVDAIAQQRTESSEDFGQRMMATLLTLMDGVNQDGVLVVAATNRLESVDPALRRHGRFDYEIEIGVPTPKGRLEILQVHLSRINHALNSEDIQALAQETHGFVGADLFALCNEAALEALRRHVQSATRESELCASWEDFQRARERISPSAMREVVLEVPKVRWNDIGGHSFVKQQLKEIVEWPQKHPESFVRIGTTPARGVLLYGPPGCSKTLMARAVAGETGLNFIAVKGPELFRKFLGESEKAVRSLFARAKAAAPSVVFFDEIDGLAVTRGSGSGGDAGKICLEDLVMSQLLIELDGVSPRNGVSVIAATNRPDKLDPALLRPGRFDRLIYVGPPDKSAREQIFEIHLRNTPCENDVSAADLASRTESYTGADIAAVCREAAMAALEEDFSTTAVRAAHFDIALRRVVPSKCSVAYESFNSKLL